MIKWLKQSCDTHELFYMENAGGYTPAYPETPPSTTADEHQPSCFALEEEKGVGWNGVGAMVPAIKEQSRAFNQLAA